MHCGDTLLFDSDVINPSIKIDPSATLNLHLWIVVTEPQPTDQLCVIVSVTTLRKHSDTTVILRSGDHPRITHDSVIRYADAQIVDARALDGVLKIGKAKAREVCPPDMLKRIQNGIGTSAFVPKKIVTFCNECWKK